MDKSWFRTAVTSLEAFTIPGILLHYIVRKRYLEDVARECLANGIKQIVILGAGFDTLAWRLHREYSDVCFIELDHPTTQQDKEQVLHKHSNIQPNLHFIPIDLAQTSSEGSLLSCPHYNRAARSLFIAEGLLMYLEPETVSSIFEFVAKHTGPNSCFAFTFLERHGNGKINFRRGSKTIDLWLKWRGEGFRWGIRRRELKQYAADKGLSLRAIAGEQTLRRLYLNNKTTCRSRLARGEYIGVAERE